MPLPSSKPAAPPVTPSVPPQLVACGERDFYRITQGALQAFEVASVLPPPHIRGSRVARQVAEVPVAEPLNVTSLASKKALVVARGGVLRYELGKSEPQRYSPIAAPEPLVVWQGPRLKDALYVRTSGSKTVAEYPLIGLAGTDAGSTPVAVAAEREQALPDFDARLFTLLADGAPLYSTPQGLIRRGREANPIPLPLPSGDAVLLFADTSPERFWAAGATGELALLDARPSTAAVFTAKVPGVVIDADVDGERVAVLSIELASQSYRPFVTIFANGKQQAQLGIGPLVAWQGQPKLDLCVMAGQPWVVVGGARWVQLLAWDSRRLLAEW